jgi:hypothetical protein
MKSKLNPVPAANRTQEKINTVHTGYVELKPEEAQKLVTGIYELDAKVKLKDSQIVTITKQKNDTITNLKQVITTKTVEIQNQLKEEYISVLHQLNPKVYSANYEDWSGKAQGAKDIIDQGNFKTIRKKLPVYKQQLVQKIETEKLALATKEAEKLDSAKQEVVSILNQLHPTLYPANFEEWSTHHAAHNSTAKALLDSGNLGAIEKKLVHYRELLKQEVQNKALLILQKEQEFKSLNDTFTIKEEEIIIKNQLLAQSNTKVKKANRKLAQEIQSKNQLALQKELEKEEIRIQKEQEIERLREQLAQKDIEIQNKDLLRDELLTQKELENQEKERLREELARKELEKQELLIQKEREKEELLVLKENELREKEELLAQKGLEINNLANSLLTKEEEIVSKDLKIGEVSQKVKKVTRKLAAKDNLLSDKEQRIEELKMLIEQSKIEKEELLAQQELALANKSHMKNQIIDELRGEVNLKENEVVDLRIQNLEKELIVEQKEKLLIQKELELADKSFAKNQVIGELQEDIGLKEKEAYKLQMELLMKQVEFYKKESELKDKANELKEKALADAHLINELQGKLLAAVDLHKNDETLKLELSVITHKVEESIANANLHDMEELSKYLSQLMKNPADKDESIDISNLLDNLSPIVHVEANLVQNPLAVINNFDINHINTTHSVYPSGEGSSFSIIDVENSH